MLIAILKIRLNLNCPTSYLFNSKTTYHFSTQIKTFSKSLPDFHKAQFACSGAVIGLGPLSFVEFWETITYLYTTTTAANIPTH